MSLWSDAKEVAWTHLRYGKPTRLLIENTLCRLRGHNGDKWICWRCFKEYRR
jgi:hypothetical protein